MFPICIKKPKLLEKRTVLNIWFGECHEIKLENQMKLLRWVAHDKDFKPAQRHHNILSNF